MRTAIEISRMTAADLVDVAALEAEGGDVHWSVEQFRQELKNPRASFFLHRQKDQIVAYGGCWIIPPEAQVTNLVVRPTHRRQGLGRELLARLILEAKTHGCETMTLELRAGNHAAFQLYGSVGFSLRGRRNRFYTHPTDDALLMEKTL